MSKVYLFLILFINVLAKNTLAQKFIWAREKEGIISTVLMDNKGCSYACGSIGNNGFITKYNAAGKKQFHVTSTGSSNNYIFQATICDDGYIYIVSQYQGTVIIGTKTITADMGIFSYYIAKYDTAGNFYWVKTMNNTYSNGHLIQPASITSNSQGDVLVFGYRRGDYNLDGINLNKGKLFLSKHSGNDGTTIWVRELTGTAIHIRPQKITSDIADNVIIAGDFGDNNNICTGLTCIFNNNVVHTVTPNTVRNIFLAQYDSNGNYKWSKSIGNQSTNDCYDVSTDNNNNVYLIGHVAGVGSVFKKFTQSGTEQWSNIITGYPRQLAKSPYGTILICDYSKIFKNLNDSLTSFGDRTIIINTDTLNGQTKWRTPPFNYRSFSKLYASNRGDIITAGGGENVKIGVNIINSGPFIALISDSSKNSGLKYKITGNIFNDKNNSCIKDSSDQGLNGFTVIAEPGPYYGIANDSGQYQIAIDSGTYNVEQIVHSSNLYLDTQICYSNNTAIVNLNNPTSLDNNFPNKYQPCYLLKLNASDNLKQDCNTTKETVISISNLGTDTAQNLILTIKYPGDVFSPLNSSIAWDSYSASDSTMIFTFTSIKPDSTIRLTIIDTVICKTTSINYDKKFTYKLNLTPKNICYPNDTIYQYLAYVNEFHRPVGVNQEYIVPQATIYPNPTSGELYLKGLNDEYSVIIYSIKGEVILITTANDKNNSINIGEQPAGIYYLKLCNNTSCSIHKIDKQ